MGQKKNKQNDQFVPDHCFEVEQASDRWQSSDTKGQTLEGFKDLQTSHYQTHKLIELNEL